jgi:hypothetical protein
MVGTSNQSVPGQHGHCHFDAFPYFHCQTPTPSMLTSTSSLTLCTSENALTLDASEKLSFLFYGYKGVYNSINGVTYFNYP